MKYIATLRRHFFHKQSISRIVFLYYANAVKIYSMQIRIMQIFPTGTFISIFLRQHSTRIYTLQRIVNYLLNITN